MAKHKRARRRRRRTVPGAAPGTLAVEPGAPTPQIRVMAYGPDGFEERPVQKVAEIEEFLARWPVTWVDVEGLGDAAVIGELGNLFGLHRLSLEDVVHVVQRPKIESYDEYLFFVARMLALEEHLESEQISFFLGEKFVLTFQEHKGDCLNPVRERIRKGRPRLGSSGPDYLAYALLDAVVDSYFPLLETYGERLESLQEEVFERPEENTISRIFAFRRELIAVRRVVWPLRDAINALLRDQSPLISEATHTYLRDCHDHTIQAMDLVESTREMVGALMDVYLSSIGNRTNEVMRVLTVFAAIFIPLTFIAGLYGMNFNTEASTWNMPELNWSLGYVFALGAMAAVAGAMLFYFWRKGWL